MQRIIHIESGVVGMPEWKMAAPVNFDLCDGEHIAIVGPNGGGKSMFVDILTGRHPLLGQRPEYDFSPSRKQLISENIKYITFKDSYGSDNDRTYYLQQRWNQQEIDETTPTVADELKSASQLAGQDTAVHGAMLQHLCTLFHLDTLFDRHTITLSSGELRKLQLTKVLLAAPRVLIIDNPFIGLDAEAREQLTEVLAQLSREQALQLILVFSKSDNLPAFITHVVKVERLTVATKITRDAYLANRSPYPAHLLDTRRKEEILRLPGDDNDYYAPEVVRMNKVSIRYGQRTILKELDWTVRNGERWALTGQNGAGKSTLLSLVCADNPQSYACNISLFGRARGTGESIWDIKKHIGYVSPEMHRAYKYNIPSIKIVASGLKDSVGLYFNPTDAEYEKCRFWMRIFGIEKLENRPFLKLSSGEQRLMLLARAFVKDPELLILDEPLHGLDDANRLLVRDVIDTFSRRRNKTIIMVSHYQEEFPACIDHKIYLQKN